MRQTRRHLRRLAVGVAFTVAATASSALTGAAAFAAPPEGSIRGAGAAGAIAESYIVVLADASAQAGNPGATAKSLASRFGGSVGHTYSTALKGFSITASAKTAKQIAGSPGVAYVEQDGEVHADGFQDNPPSWGLDRIDQRNLPLDTGYTYPVIANKVTAYILDTGIRTTHTDFGGRASWGTNTTGDGNNTDCNGHGTHVSGTVAGATYGVAKAARLVAVKVLGCSGSGSWAGVIAGIDWVTNNHAAKAVANMSLGGGVNSAVTTAVTNSIADGVTYAVAAGNNDGDACNTSPASTPNALTVGSTTSTDARSSFSNWGTCLDLFAPGSSITSTWNTTNTETNTISGTSMASPHVAGAAAMMLAMHPTFTPAQVGAALIHNAVRNKVTDPKVGSPNRLLYVGWYGWFTNSTNVAIPDTGVSAFSNITLAGLFGNASPHTKVLVNIRHTYRGDLRVYLVAPDASTYLLKWSDSTDWQENVITTYWVNVSGEAKNGTWRLKVQDVASRDTGYIDSWSIAV